MPNLYHSSFLHPSNFVSVKIVFLQVACRAQARISLSASPAGLRCASARRLSPPPRLERRLVGVTGLEPVTLRLSSACSNQLSYTPNAASPPFETSNLRFEIQVGGAEETRTPDL